MKLNVFFFCFLTSLFFIVTFVQKELWSASKSTAIPQPSFVTGNIESLLPLAKAHYLNGKPVIFLSEMYQREEMLSLLEQSHSIIFHHYGLRKLLYNTAKEGFWQNADEQIKDSLKEKHVSYLFSFDEEAENTEKKTAVKNYTVEIPGEYQVWAYLSPKNEQISFRNLGRKLSGVKLLSETSITIKESTGNDIVILPLSDHKLDLMKYSNLQISYILPRTSESLLKFVLELDTDKDNQEDTLLIYQQKIEKEEVEKEIVEKETLEEAELPVKEAAIDKCNFNIDFSKVTIKQKDFWYKVNRELGRLKKVNMYQWYYDTLGSKFTHYSEGDYLVVNSDFSKSNHFVITKHFKPIDLKGNPYFVLDYRLENPYAQALCINFKVDTTGNGRPDTIINTNQMDVFPGSANQFTFLKQDGEGKNIRQLINVLKLSGIDSSNDKSICNLVEVIILCRGEGNFYLKEFSNGSCVTGKDALFFIEGPTEVAEKIPFGVDLKDNKIENFNLKLEDILFSKDADIALLDVKEKIENEHRFFIVNDIPQQIKRKLKNIENCTLKGITFFEEHREGSKNSINLPHLEEIQIFSCETKDIPKYVFATKPEAEWQQQFEEDTLRYGLETVLDKNYLEKEKQEIEQYFKGKSFSRINAENVIRDNHEWEIDDFEQDTYYSAIYNELVSAPIFNFDGEQFNLKKSIRIVNEENSKKLGIVEKSSIFNSSFQFKDININDDGDFLIYPHSKYFEVNMIELRKLGSRSLYEANGGEPEIAFKKINPTRYVVDVKAEKPFWLVFSESFHTGWKAFVRPVTVNRQPSTVRTDHWSALVSARRDKGNRVELTEHQMVNGYANGWYVPVGQGSRVKSQKSGEGQEVIKAGEFQIVLEYKPQRLFEIGVLISGITLTLCIGYLCWGGIRKIIIKKKKTILPSDFTDYQR